MKKLTEEQLEIVKREHPEFFGFKDNTWYISAFSGSLQFNVKGGKGYGLRGGIEWFSKAMWLMGEEGFIGTKWFEAREEQIKEALIKEAKRRGLVPESYWVSLKTNDRCYASRGSVYTFHGGNLYLSNGCIFSNGIWANPTDCFYSPIVPEGEDINKDIKTLKDKYPNYNWTIIAQSKP